MSAPDGGLFPEQSGAVHATTLRISIGLPSSTSETLTRSRGTSGAGQLYFRRDGDLVGSNGIATALNTWYHVVVTYDGTNLTFYLNGDLRHTKVSTTNLANTANPTFIGCRSQGGTTHVEHFTGAIDEVLLYDKALTAAQVDAHYLSGRGGLP